MGTCRIVPIASLELGCAPVSWDPQLHTLELGPTYHQPRALVGNRLRGLPSAYFSVTFVACLEHRFALKIATSPLSMNNTLCGIVLVTNTSWASMRDQVCLILAGKPGCCHSVVR